MRVAVVFSGQIRGSYINNIIRMREIIPTADFFFTSWEDQREKDVAGIINRFYKEPQGYRIGAVGNKRVIKRNIKLLRKIKNGELSEKDFPPRWIGRSHDKIIDELWAPILSKKKAAHSMKQVVAHGLAVRDFCSSQDYDIIIRCRYDITVCRSLKAHIKDFCEQVYEYGAPYGFHAFNDEGTLENCIKPKKIVSNGMGRDLRDFIIIHRSDLFSPDLAFYLFNKKALMPAELGWWQLLCRPYALCNVDVKGYVMIESQNSQRKMYFDWHKQNIFKLPEAQEPGGIRFRYHSEEKMNEVSDDIDNFFK